MPYSSKALPLHLFLVASPAALKLRVPDGLHHVVRKLGACGTVGAAAAMPVLPAALPADATVATKLPHRTLGRTGVNVIGRLMGMILVAMAIQFMSDGIHGLFPGAP